jgi:hypothetical protein
MPESAPSSAGGVLIGLQAEIVAVQGGPLFPLDATIRRRYNAIPRKGTSYHLGR